MVYKADEEHEGWCGGKASSVGISVSAYILYMLDLGIWRDTRMRQDPNWVSVKRVSEFLQGLKRNFELSLARNPLKCKTETY